LGAMVVPGVLNRNHRLGGSDLKQLRTLMVVHEFLPGLKKQLGQKARSRR
jgi:hypothetical protein